MLLRVRSLIRFAFLPAFIAGWSAVQPAAAVDQGEHAKDAAATIIATQDGNLQMSPIRLPLEIRGWKQAGEVQRISRDTIFDYMNGAGELYIGYRFRELEVREYESSQNGPILVELYFMESPDDAFGLLSLDWGGEVLDESVGLSGGSPSALFGSGLLRMRAGTIYVRMLAEQDAAATRQAIIELAKVITEQTVKPVASAPALLAVLPEALDDYSTAAIGKVFLRSHLVLNSVYFLATRNILQLGPECEAVSSEYRKQGAAGGQQKPRLLAVKYPSAEAALKAAESFEQAYLANPKRVSELADWRGGEGKTVEIEDGWLGFGQSGAFLVLAFDCPDDETARRFLNQTGIQDHQSGERKLERGK